MLPILVILCLASSQVFGAVISNADAKVAQDYAESSSHSDGEYHETKSSKDSGYQYEKASAQGVVDGQAVKAYANGHAVYPYYAAPAHHGAYVNGHNEYAYAYEKGSGYDKEDSYTKDYTYNNDDASEEGSHAAEGHQDYNNNYVAPVYYYNHPGHYAASPFLHAVHKRSAVYGYPSYGYGYKYGVYPAYNGYYGNYYNGYPLYNHHAAVHKRSAPYGYPAYSKYGYYGHPAYYGNHYGYDYPAYQYPKVQHHY